MFTLKTFNEEAQSLVRELQKCSPNFSEWKQCSSVAHTPEVRSPCLPLLSPPFLGRGATPTVPWAPLLELQNLPFWLVLENTQPSMLLPAEVLCQLSQQRGRGQSEVQGEGRAAWG